MHWTKVYFSTVKMQIFNMSVYAQFDELLFEIILFKGLVSHTFIQLPIWGIHL